MRISSTLFFQTGLNSINAQQSDLLHLFQQTASGKRMVSPADDPLAASQAVNIRQAQSLNQRFADNREQLKSNLGIELNALDSTVTLLQDVKTRLVQAGNGTLSDADRATLATVFSNAKSTLLGLANSTDGSGQYLFSGHAGNQPAFLADNNGRVAYNGDQGQRLIQADQTRQIAYSDVGSTIFAQAAQGSRAYVTQAGVANTGTGLIGAPVITHPKGDNVGGSFQIVFSETPAPDSTVQYTVHALGETGNLTAIDGGGPHDFQSGTNALTIPGGLQVAFSGNPKAGDAFQLLPAVANEGGVGVDLNIFNALDDIVLALNTPTQGNIDASVGVALGNALATAMQKIDISYDQVLTVRSSVGARLNEIEAIDANGAARDLSYSGQISRLEDLDYYSATTQLQLRQSALEAAALAFRKIQSANLFSIGSN